MKQVILLAYLILPALLASGQGAVGSWDDHLPYGRSYGIATGGGKVWSSTGSAILIHDLRSGTNSKLSKVSGLTETAISHIAWCDAEESLIIVYRSTGVDIVKKGVITHIPDIKNKYIPGLKEINSVTVTGSRALLAASFGIVVVDIKGRFISDTWRPGPDGETNSVNESALLNSRIYAVTNRGVWSAPQDRQGLSYYGNWERLDGFPEPEAGYSHIAVAGSSLMITKPGNTSPAGSRDSLFLITPGQPASLIVTEPAGTFRALDGDGTRVVASLSSSIAIYSAQGEIIRQITGFG